MARFRNSTGSDLSLFKPTRAGHPDAHLVKAGEIVEVSGEVKQTTDTAYVVGSGPSARAYPKAVWTLDEERPATKKQQKEGE